MKDILIPNPDSAIERINYMSSVADEPVPDYRYEKIMSEEDIAEERETFADLSIDLQRLEIEKAELVADMNKRIKEKREAAKVSLALIRTGRMEVVETVYLIADPNERKVGTFNQWGTLISERTMKKAEMLNFNRSLFNEGENAKTGTDN